MKKLLIYGISLFLAVTGCSSDKNENEASVTNGANKIEVVEHMNGGGYTFLKGERNGSEFWVAVREMPVENGEVYYYSDAMEMNNFESKSLNKTFASILFVNEISKTNAGIGRETVMPGMASSSDGHTKPVVEPESDIKVTPLSDGMTVEMINKDKASLDGKTVKVRGVVTKYNAGIMNRNWIHIQDGTSYGEGIDLTVTSDQPTKVGETIVIEGTIATDKDFGAGYFYDIIVENATITAEEKI